LKTTTTCYALPLWLLGCNPEVRIMMATASKRLGERRVSVIKDHIVENEGFSEVFGYLYNENAMKKWASDAIDVWGRRRAADHSVEVFGWGSAIEGAGCDISIADDVQNYDNAMTSDARAKQWQWLNEPFMRRLDPVTRTLIIIQTRHAVDDYAGHCEDEASRGTWDFKAYDAVLNWPPDDLEFKEADEHKLAKQKLTKWDVSNLKDPEKWRKRCLCDNILPLETLMNEWRPLSERTAFYRTRLNRVEDPETKWFSLTVLADNARADGGQRSDGAWRPKLCCWDVNIGVPQPGSELYLDYEKQGVVIDKRVVSIDTASTQVKVGKNPDWTVIELWGMDSQSHLRVLLDIDRFRTGSPQVFRDRLRRFLDAYQPNFTIFEGNAMARWVGIDTQTALGWPITQYNRGRNALAEVEDFKNLIESGMMLYCWGDKKSERKMMVFENELVDYPNGQFDDTLDAAVQAQVKMKPRGVSDVRVLSSKSQDREPDELEAMNVLSRFAGSLARLEELSQCLATTQSS